MLFDRFKKFVEQKKTGSTIVGLSQSKFEQYEIALPSGDEQLKIIERLNNVDNILENEKQCLIKYQKLKQGLMQDLLTGKVAVSV